MGLMEQIKQDIKSITTNKSDFGVDLTFTAPDESTVTVAGTFKSHRTTFDEFGTPRLTNSNLKNITCSVSPLVFGTYPCITNTEYDFRGHTVTYSGSTYVINEWWPDVSAALIVFILGEYGS